MKSITMTELRKSMKTHLDYVSKDSGTIMVPRKSGLNAVVMISEKEYNSINETLHLMSTKANRNRLEESIQPYKNYFDDFINSKIESGKYNSAGEVIRAALRLLEQEEQKLSLLRNELELGERSPMIDDYDPAKHLEDLHKKHL